MNYKEKAIESYKKYVGKRGSCCGTAATTFLRSVGWADGYVGHQPATSKRKDTINTIIKGYEHLNLDNCEVIMYKDGVKFSELRKRYDIWVGIQNSNIYVGMSDGYSLSANINTKAYKWTQLYSNNAYPQSAVTLAVIVPKRGDRMSIKGIDVSQWQGSINWAEVASDGVKFAVLREGYRKTIDTRFLEYVAGCKKHGIPVAVYHFIYTDGATIAENAESTVKNLKQAGLDIATTWIFSDLEYNTWEKNGETCTKAKCTEYTKRYLEALKALGCRRLGIYCNTDYYDHYYQWSALQGYVLWIADYSGRITDYDACIQQTGSKGSVKGISGNVDMDTCMVDDFFTTYNYTEVSTMTKTEKATQYMETVANDNSHGYSQVHRWPSEGHDYDCSSLVISAWTYGAGVDVRGAGASYTGNMRAAFLKMGFTDVTSKINLSTGAGLIRGDVLLNQSHHTAMYCGNGKEVEASIDENGGVQGKQQGDQTGREILIRSYRNYPWTHVLRYKDADGSVSSSTASTGAHDFTTKSGKAINKTKLYEVTVRASDGLNVRTAPDVSANTCSFSPLVNGETVTVCDEMANGWLYIMKNDKYGFVSGKYVTKVETQSTQTTTDDDDKKLSNTVYTNGVVTTTLNVRLWAGTEYNTCSFSPLHEGDTVGICDTVKADNGMDWYFIKFNGKFGFVCSKYVRI